jgi:hypothetical protein
VAGWRQALAAGCAVVGLTLASGCQLIPGLPGSPSSPTPTPLPGAPPPKPAPAPTAAAFTPFWVKNHRLTDMWSGPSGEANVVSFGTTSAQFCSFQVVRPPEGDRVYVYNPYSDNYFWIDADAIGPVPDPPERRPGPKPDDQNCSDAIYEG